MRSHITRNLALAAALGLVLAAGPLRAQGEPKPGPEHDVLKASVGVWDAALSSQGSESKGVSTIKMTLGGLWLIDEFKAEFGGATFEGRGSTTYDATKKKYVSVWIDSMSTAPMIAEGTYDKATRTLTLVGDMPMPDGSVVKATQTTVTKDANTRVFTLSMVGPDGKAAEMMKVTYTRRK